MVGRVGGRGLVYLIVLGGHCGGSFVMKVGHQHCSSLEINHTITACLYLLQRCRVQFDVSFRSSGTLGGGGFGAPSSFDLADQWRSSIFGMDGPIVPE